MTFAFQCPHCKTTHEVADQILGKTVRCSACSNLVEVDPEAFAEPLSQSDFGAGEVASDQNSDPGNPYSAKSDQELLAAQGKSAEQPSVKATWQGDSAPPYDPPDDSETSDDEKFEAFDVPKDNSRVDEEMDMTPMVDVTFLLLIFFMVTASFTLQKSMDLPTKTQDEPSPNVVEDFEDNPEYVSVFVSPYNEYRVRTSEYDWEDAPNRHELRVRLTDALQAQSKPEKLLIMAHADCFHDKVIQAMDIGIELQYKIQVIMTEEEF